MIKHVHIFYIYVVLVLDPNKNFFAFRGDTLSNSQVDFTSAEDAAAFCEKNGMGHYSFI